MDAGGTPRLDAFAHLGRRAEQAATEHLEAKGYIIIDQNWRTRYCEIDIVAKKTGVIYFVEVKYRSTATHGTGLDFITSAKLRRMSFAAELWVSKSSWRGLYQLAVIQVSTPSYIIDEILLLT